MSGVSAAARRPDGGGGGGAAGGGGDSTPGSDAGGERITRLFPKCRPRARRACAAGMHQRAGRSLPQLSPAGDPRLTDLSNINTLSSDDERARGVDPNLLIFNSKGAYKLRDSRTIELAGGREVYCASRSKARKLRQGGGMQRHQPRHKPRLPAAAPPDNLQRISSLDMKKMVSKQTSPSHMNGSRSLRHVSNNGTASPEVSSLLDAPPSQKGSPIAVVADGEVVVLDDISQDWKGLRLNLDASDAEMASGRSSPSEHTSERTEAPRDSEAPRLPRVIGELPIAEYEGSPKRYGVSVAPARSPRPGFPQRVVDDSGSEEQTRPSSSAAFDYLYEFSETRKVLEEFFQCPVGAGQTPAAEEMINFQELQYSLVRQARSPLPSPPRSPPPPLSPDASWRARRAPPPRRFQDADTRGRLSPTQQMEPYERELNVVELSVGTDSGGSGGGGGGGGQGPGDSEPRPAHLALSPDTTDCDSNCGDLDSELSLVIMENDVEVKDSTRCSTQRVSMPLVEDGLSSGHSDTDNNNLQPVCPELSLVRALPPSAILAEDVTVEPAPSESRLTSHVELHALDPIVASEVSPPPPAPAPHRGSHEPLAPHLHQLWIPPGKRANSAASTESAERKPTSGDDDEADTDLETDRLLGQQRTDDQGFFDDKGWRKPKSRTVMPAGAPVPASGASSGTSPHAHSDTPLADKDKDGKKKGKNKEGAYGAASVLIEGVLFRARYLGSTQLACEGQPTKATRMLQAEEAVSRIKQWGEEEVAGGSNAVEGGAYDAGGGAYDAGGGAYSDVYAAHTPAAVFRLSFLGSVEVDEDGPVRRRKKRLKKNMVEEAVTKIKAPEGESQPSTEVDLFISTEKIMVLNTELKEIMMDHALRTISYIADIGELVVLMARRRFVPHDSDSEPSKLHRTPKMICHVFESEEAQFIAQSIGQAFQVAYMEFLKANGIEDHSFVKEMDYQEVLNSQEIFGDELQMFAKKELQKEVVVPKTKGEILGVVVVESGWGSMLPTVVIANLAPAGAAARCGHLNIGDQIIAINGVSLVGLPLSTCQTYIKNSKNQTVVKLTVVPCPPVVEVKIKRPDTKYQLGFSVQNGVICSLLRGGIAERGGVRVGHRIIEINSQSVVAVPHERIVNLLATSVGEILMKTMPTSMFRLLTGQENPLYI